MIKNSLNPHQDIANCDSFDSFLIDSLTLKNVEAKKTANSYILKLTLAEDIQYHDGASNIMYFLPFAENDENKHELDAEAFFYFVSKLNQPIQIPIRRSWVDDEKYRYWVLSDEAINEIKVERDKWHSLGYNDLTDYCLENKRLVEQGTRKEKNWADIHPNFAKKDHWGKTYQQLWEEKGLTYQDAQEWITVGFKPDDDYSVKQWKNYAFTPQQTQSWIKIGLKPYDYEFAAYLRGKNHQPSQDLNLEKLSKEFNDWKQNPAAQEYLDYLYPKEQRNTTKTLIISQKNLTGNLDLNDFVNLEGLYCKSNQLTTLNLTNCLKLKILDCRYNNLTDLILPSLAEQLTFLNIGNNNLSGDCSLFSHLVNLKELNLGNIGYGFKKKIKEGIYNRFTGSLEPLKDLTKLESLDIDDTDIDSGLEYLPESIKKFSCFAKQRKDAKVKTIANLLGNEHGMVKSSGGGGIANFLQLFQAYKQKIQINDLLKQTTPEQIKINSLEARIQELVDLIKKQWEKIYNAYLYCVSEPEEKELLDQLIKAHIELTRFKKQEFSSPNYRKKLREYEDCCREFEKELEKKLEKRLQEKGLKNELTNSLEESMNEINRILTECEEIVGWQLELEEKLKSKILLIENQNSVLQITSSNEGRKITESEEEKQQKNKAQIEDLKRQSLSFQIELAKVQSKLEAKQEEIKHWREKLTTSTPSVSITPIFHNSPQSNREKSNITVQQGHAIVSSSFQDNANLNYNNIKEPTDQEIATKTKRQLSLESQAKNSQEKTKLSKPIESQAYQKEPIQLEANTNWQNIHSSFAPQLTQLWINHNFTHSQTQDWANALGSQFNPQEPAFYAWLRYTKNLTPEQVLNHSDLNALRQEYQATQQTAQIIHNPPKP